MEDVKKTPANTPDTGFTDDFLIHAMTPRNLGVISNPDGYGHPTGACGDSIEIYIKVRDEAIDRIAFMPDGCTHTIACASVVTTLAQGKPLTEALQIDEDDIVEALGGLPPDHLHCARLAASTLKLAIKNYLKNKQAPWKKLYRTGNNPE